MDKNFELEIKIEKANKELVEKDKVISMLREINYITNSKSETNEIFSEIMEIVKSYLDFDYVYIRYDTCVIYGEITDLYNRQFIKGLRLIQMSDYNEKNILSDIEKMFEFYSFINILKNENGVPFGFIIAGKESDKKEIIENNKELLSVISSMAALTVERNSYYKERNRKESLEKDLEIAQKIQTSYIPKTFPSIDGFSFASFYKPAKLVGGDYFDWVKASEDMYAFIVGDVSGKGSGAALYMIKARENIRVFSKNARDAALALNNVNDNLSNDVDVEKFITAFYMLLDIENKTIMYSNAGHNPMLLLRNDKIEEVTTIGIPLGITCDTKYVNREIELVIGDIIILYTDGVIEARNIEREFYGSERFYKIVLENSQLHPSEIIDEINKDLMLFSTGAKQNDDCTILIIKYIG